jgi:hypothetical protein
MPAMLRRALRRRGSAAAASAVLAVLVAAGSTAGSALAASGGASVGSGVGTTTTTSTGSSAADPFAGKGMWIWNIANSSGGDPATIAAKAEKIGLRFVVVKAANGTQRWPGFTRAFVSALQRLGLRVCGYQRVMPHGPKSQTSIFASQIRNSGATCAVIDAESELEGRYLTAQAYMTNLRKLLGTKFPIALTSFPWVGYHPTFPYSVFLGAGGAQVNMPQIYWKDIGTSVATGFANTYPSNAVFGRPIRPLGQLYGKPSSADITRFRATALSYGATGISWWDWEEASSSGWKSLAQRDPATPKTVRAVVPPTLSLGSQTDLVRWARTRLKAHHATGVSTGSAKFDAKLRNAVVAYQTANDLPITGSVDPATWRTLVPKYAYGR